MKMKVLKWSTSICGEVECVKNLYMENPAGCYFLTEHKIIESKNDPQGEYRAPVVELRDWHYDDFFELMKLNMNLSEEEVGDYIQFLRNVVEFTEWRPLVIGAAFVVFEILRQDKCERKKIQALVNGFQRTHGFENAPTEWNAYWIGPE